MCGWIGVLALAAVAVAGCKDAGFQLVLPEGDPVQEGCIPLPENALHWWPGDGTGVDLLGGLDARPMDGTTFVPSLVESGSGEAFSFDGVDAMARVPDAPTLNPRASFAVMAWARPGPNPTPNGAIIGKGHPWAESWVLDTHRDSWRAVVRDRNGFAARIYGSDLVPNAWSHVAMRWDGQVLALYVDGRLDNAVRVSSISVNRGPVGIGARSEAGFGDSELDLEFAGEIDEVVFFGRSLGEEEIRAVFEARAAGICKS